MWVTAIGGVVRRNKTGLIRVTNITRRIGEGSSNLRPGARVARLPWAAIQLCHIAAMQGEPDHAVS